MEDSLFRDYSKKHVQFYDESFPAFLELGFALVSAVEKSSIVDLGCGDGRLLFALHQKGLLNGFSEIVGVDISAERIERLKKNLPFVNGCVSDASNVKDCLSSFFDYVICSQVIEHVRDDVALVAEINRLLKCGGVAYISSVVKHWYGVYFYFNNGSFRLDPTHVREYSSIAGFVSSLNRGGFKVIDIKTRQVMFPLLDLFVRLFVKLGLVEPDAGFFKKHIFLSKLRILRIPVLGYKTVEAIVKKSG